MLKEIHMIIGSSRKTSILADPINKDILKGYFIISPNIQQIHVMNEFLIKLANMTLAQLFWWENRSMIIDF
jgi:hypothetical protein